MEDQGERSPQTFVGNNFSFPQPRRKQGDRCTFKRVLNIDSGFKAGAWTLENGNVHISWRSRQENPRSPSILPNGEHQVNPVLTVRFLISKNVQLIRRFPCVNA